MKRNNLKYLAIIVAIAPMLAGCPKPKPNVAPDPDTEVQTAIDVTFATQVITDVDMICSFVGENDPSVKFYAPEPGITQTMTVVRDISAEYLFTAYNKTKCLDGHMRDGTVSMLYKNLLENTSYMRDFRFRGELTLEEYKIDGWHVRTAGGYPCVVTNLLPGANYNQDQTKLSWLIEGNFEFTHPTDPSKNMTYNCKITKTLANSSDRNVLHQSHQQMIKWALAKVEYRGTISGATAGGVPFTMVLDEKAPLTRDFTCFPDKIGGVETQPAFKGWNREFHPFISGIATLNTGNAYPRQIYYGNEGSPDLSPQCDNTGEVLIKGISYRVDFVK